MRRIAEAYGVSYDAFLLNALGHKRSGARDLTTLPFRCSSDYLLARAFRSIDCGEMFTSGSCVALDIGRGKQRTSAGSGGARLPLRNGITPPATHVGEPGILVAYTQRGPGSCCRESCKFRDKAA